MAEEDTGRGSVAAESMARVLRRRAACGELWIPLEGSSMLPTVEAPAEGLVGVAEHPRWGEVWAFVDSGGSITVHRVLGRGRGGRWIMRGDGAPRTDPPVYESVLVGPVRRMRRNGRTHDLGRSRRMAVRLQARRVLGAFRRHLTYRPASRSNGPC